MTFFPCVSCGCLQQFHRTVRHELPVDLVHDSRIVNAGPDDANGPAALELAEERPNRRRTVADGGVDGDGGIAVEQIAELLQDPPLGHGASPAGRWVYP